MHISKTKQKLLFSFAASALLTAGILIAINVIAGSAYLRIDFSAGKIYSVSPATKNIIRKLEDPVLIDIYYSRKLPPQITVMKNYFTDILKEYKRVSRGKIDFSLIEVKPTDQARQNAIRNGIIPVRFDIYSKEKFEATEGYFGVVFKYRKNKKAIPYIDTIQGLEYLLTSKIKSLTEINKPKVGIIADYGCVSYNTFPQTLKEQIEENFSVEPVSLKQTEKIDADIKSVLLAGPQENIPETDLFKLDQYLLSGGNLFIAIDTKKINPRVFTLTRNETGLESFLSHSGIEITPEIIMDAQSQQIQVTRRQGIYIFSNIVKYPPFITVTDLNRKNPITKDISSVVFPFASPIRLNKETDAKSQVLIKSSKQSWLTQQKDKKVITVSPFEKIVIGDDAVKGPFNIAVHIKDNFKPFYNTPPDKNITDFLTESKAEGRLIVTGTSKFISHQYSMPQTNYLLFANMLDWLNQAEELISIRSKTAGFYPLREIPLYKKVFIKYANILLPPFAAVMMGLFMWNINTRRKNKYHKILTRK